MVLLTFAYSACRAIVVFQEEQREYSSMSKQATNEEKKVDHARS
jgi:hypothetical protein